MGKEYQVSKARNRETTYSYLMELKHFFVELNQPFLDFVDAHSILHPRSKYYATLISLQPLIESDNKQEEHSIVDREASVFAITSKLSYSFCLF